MKLKSLQELPESKYLRSLTEIVKPKFHIDVLSFGEESLMAEYVRLKLLNTFPGIITSREFNSDKGWRVEVQILHGKAQLYVDFLRQYKLLDRSMQTAIEEERKISKTR